MEKEIIFNIRMGREEYRNAAELVEKGLSLWVAMQIAFGVKIPSNWK